MNETALNQKIKKIKLAITILGLTISLSSNALINGKVLSGYPDLVRLDFADGTMCTGAYIDETSILTAAHCLVDAKGDPTQKLEKVISAQEHVLPVQHLRTLLHPKFDRSWWPEFDVGVIKTSKNLTFHKDFKFAHEPLPRFSKVTLLGCGISSFDPKTRTRMQGESSFLRIRNILFFLGKSQNDPASAGLNTSIAQNDSGAPILDIHTGEIIAIATQSTSKTSFKFHLPAISVGTVIIIPEVFEFINTTLGYIPNSESTQ